LESQQIGFGSQKIDFESQLIGLGSQLSGTLAQGLRPRANLTRLGHGAQPEVPAPARACRHGGLRLLPQRRQSRLGLLGAHERHSALPRFAEADHSLRCCRPWCLSGLRSRRRRTPQCASSSTTRRRKSSVRAARTRWHRHRTCAARRTTNPSGLAIA
jgi:hypothetical protein